MRRIKKIREDFGVQGKVNLYKTNNPKVPIAEKQLINFEKLRNIFKQNNKIKHNTMHTKKTINYNKLVQKLRKIKGTSISKLPFFKIDLRGKEPSLIMPDLSDSGRYKTRSFHHMKEKEITASILRTIGKDMALLHDNNYYAPTDSWIVVENSKLDTYLLDIGGIKELGRKTIFDNIYVVLFYVHFDPIRARAFIDSYNKNTKNKINEKFLSYLQTKMFPGIHIENDRIENLIKAMREYYKLKK